MLLIIIIVLDHSFDMIYLYIITNITIIISSTLLFVCKKNEYFWKIFINFHEKKQI